MAPIISDSSHLTNPLATSTQVETSVSRLDGIPKDLEDSVRFQTARLLQAAGILLRLPQDIIAQAITILYRFWTGPDGRSLVEHDARDVAAAALYLTAKPSGHAISPRKLLVVFSYLRSTGTSYETAAKSKSLDMIDNWTFPEADYEASRNRLYHIESEILRVLGFDTHVALPFTICIHYLQTLDVFHSATGSSVAKRAIAHLNTALLSPQLLYLTHQPPALATAAIYLSARELGVKLPDTEWWEVFDTDREELGFLVVALQSIEGFAQDDKRKWGHREVPLTVEDIRAELERRHMLGEGE